MHIGNTLSSDGPGGAETMVLRLSEQLRDDGHHVVPVTIVGGVGWLGERYRLAGFAPRTVRISQHWIDIPFLRGLLDIIRREQLDVLHSHEFEMAVYGAAASRIARIPHVITMHGGLTVWTAWQRRVALRWAIRNSAATTVVSGATRTQFAHELGVSPDALRVVPNGVPIVVGDSASPRREFNCAQDEVVLLAVGNLERNKGHRELLEALVALDARSTVRRWKLIIAGGRGGPEHDHLLKYAHERGFADRLHVVTNRSDIPDLQAAADIFVMPSLWEGLPMATLEAMVAGKAIIASNTGGIPEAIADGRDGLLVPPGDVGALTQALSRAMGDADLRRRLGDAARTRALNEFSVAAMTRQYEAVYAEACSPSRRRLTQTQRA